MSYVAINGRPLRAKEGDTVTFSFQLQDHNKSPVDISTSTVRVVIGDKKAMLLNKEVTKVDAAQGLISFSIGESEFLPKGFYDVEFIVTHADTTTETFPTKNHLGFEVEGSVENREDSTQVRSALTVLISETRAVKTEAEGMLGTIDTKMTEVDQKVTDIEARTANIETTVTEAETATTNANNAASSANTAATNANTARDNANTATTNANDAATSANTAATNANTAATNANDKATLADTAATNANNAATSANEAIGGIDAELDNIVHMGDYSASTSYAKNNSVRYNGSTYRAIQDTLGNLPTNTLYWQLEAIKGADGADGADGLNGADGKDGTGTVNSVNSVSPDQAGNVVLTPASIGAATSGHTHTLNSLSDVDVTTSAEGQVLTLVNGVWVGSTTSSAVSSVNNKTGAVTLTYTDVNAAAANHIHSDATTSVAGFMSAADKTKLNGIAASANNYVHPSGDGNLHVPATSTTNNGRVLKAGSTAGSLSWGTLAWDDIQSKPTTFSPTAHVHAIADITNLQTTLDGKAASTHSHTISDVTNLQTTLDSKAASSHTHGNATTSTSGFMSGADKTKLDGVATGANNYSHPSGDGNLHVPATGTTNNANVLRAGSTAGSLGWGRVSYTELSNIPTTFTPSAHTHAISEVTNLQTALDGKAAASHAHAISDVTNLQTTLNGKSNTGHSHAISDVTNLQTTLDGKAASSHTHTIANVTNLQTALDGKSNTDHTHALNALSDVSTTGAAANSVLKNNGSSWVASNESTMETRTTDPTSPAVGRFWLRTDL